MGFQPTTTEFRSDALTSWAIRPWVQLAVRANSGQLLQFHRFFSATFILIKIFWGNHMSALSHVDCRKIFPINALSVNRVNRDWPNKQLPSFFPIWFVKYKGILSSKQINKLKHKKAHSAKPLRRIRFVFYTSTPQIFGSRHITAYTCTYNVVCVI